jgi:cobalt-zinc-cadmium efflux system protein
MVKAGMGLVRESGHIFLEAAPTGLAPEVIGRAMAHRPHVAEVHDLHIWEITSGHPALSAHVLVDADQDCHAVRVDLTGLLAREHRIEHVTLQVDHAAADLLDSGDGHRDEHCEDPHGPIHRPTGADRHPIRAGGCESARPQAGEHHGHQRHR